jgi:hypothetical protein
VIRTYLYRLAGVASAAALFANVYKHGWQLGSVAVGVTLTVLLSSLGVVPERRTLAWEIRYVLTAVMVVGLAAFRFLR